MSVIAYLRQRVASFRCAFKGVGITVASQAHARIHLLAALLVVFLADWLAISALEWGLLLLAIALVWVSETINTAIEFVVDLASPEFHVLAGKAKDVAAGAVLLAALLAAAIGLIVLAPKLLLRLGY